MSRVKVRHYVVKRGQAFWQPTKKMRALGFFSVPLGQDGPDAWARAEQWNDRWDKTRRREAPSPAMVAADNLSPERSEELTVYPSRALVEGSGAIGAPTNGPARRRVHAKTGGAVGSGSNQFSATAMLAPSRSRISRHGGRRSKKPCRFARRIAA